MTSNLSHYYPAFLHSESSLFCTLEHSFEQRVVSGDVPKPSQARFLRLMIIRRGSYGGFNICCNEYGVRCSCGLCRKSETSVYKGLYPSYVSRSLCRTVGWRIRVPCRSFTRWGKRIELLVQNLLSLAIATEVNHMSIKEYCVAGVSEEFSMNCTTPSAMLNPLRTCKRLSCHTRSKSMKLWKN
ncbi:hypothetical protein DPMN_020464 [Dreissena polymorpha]|uniref:Uncharacterized protein n=1 Tax=Dreissena polymorpha TaxID=45954 RepID=A0A9D4NM70_DREPO|nr:hypothetical protein DPMN_020464 [Dreissena polymorpha]